MKMKKISKALFFVLLLSLTNNKIVNAAHVLDGEIRMSLFRSPTKDAFGVKTDTSALEIGEKVFRYSLIPYKGIWKDNSCYRKAQTVNQPLMAKILPTRIIISAV